MAVRPRRSVVNLAQPRLGAEVVFATDDFFAAKERLIDPAPPVFRPDRYDENGKWMDGWESRRRRDGGYDHCIVHLGHAGMVDAVEIDTRHFTGNYPPAASIDGARTSRRLPDGETVWHEIVGYTELAGDDRCLAAAEDPGPWTHLRLNIFPDGGVARLRVLGRRQPDWSKLLAGERLDMAALTEGGSAVVCNDEHFGVLANILAPGPGANMGDGWETRRRREPGHDWGIIRLAAPAIIDEVVIDTAYFKGNYPSRVSLQGGDRLPRKRKRMATASERWPELLAPQTMSADAEHRYSDAVCAHDPVQFVRINLFPDGGISRLRLFGRMAT